MNNSDNLKNSQEIRKDIYTDGDRNLRTNVTRTTETVNNGKTDVQSYQNGYLQGQSSERNYQERIVQRDTDNTSRGIILGLLLTLIIGLTVGAVWYFNQRNSSVENTTTPSEVPTTNTASPAGTQNSQNRTTIIERTREVPTVIERTKEVPTVIEKTKEVPTVIEKTKEVPVPVFIPEQKSPPTTTPNVNINVPPQEGATKAAPSTTENTPTAPSNSNTSTSEGVTNSDTNTPTSSTENEPVVPSNSPSPEENIQNSPAQ
ncbi:IMCp domain-containing protein [Scytonema sp. NUACC26]|uniref:IMCp domain-containing protein n=1 Tax=Scytonema sp. NUACC26 TaxID=3140176 RepID=UPI0034DBE402